MAWLGIYENRRKVTIDNSEIDGTLTNFPVTIAINSSSGTGASDLTDIFDTVGANWDQLAVTSSDGVTVLTTEVALWDDTNERGELFVKVPSVSSSADTELYIYYHDSSYSNPLIDVTGTTVAEGVWDSNFIMVHHLSQDPTGTIIDSTSNDTDSVTVEGTMLSGDLVDSLTGKGLDFDGVDDCINFGIGTPPGDITGDITVEAFASWVSGGDSNPAMVARYDTAGNGKGWLLSTNSTTSKVSFGGRDDSGSFRSSGESTNSYQNAGYDYFSGRRDGSVWKLYADGSDTNSADAVTTGSISGNEECGIGAQHGVGNVWDNFFKGIISEARVSDIARDDEWVKATGATLNDELVSYGSSEPYVPSGIKSGWWADVRIGGSEGAMDAIEYASIINGDICIVIDESPAFVVYRWDATSGATEDGDTVIRADDDSGGTGRWLKLVDHEFKPQGVWGTSGLKIIDPLTKSFNIVDPDTSASTLVYQDVSDFYFYNGEDGGFIRFTGTNASSTLTRLMDMDPDDGIKLFNQGVSVKEFSSDGTMAGDSDLAVPTEKAVKTYVDTSVLTTVPDRYPLLEKNLAINGNFDVWQRGTSTFSSTGYTCDRWKMEEGGGATMTVGRGAHAVGQSLPLLGNPRYYVDLANTAGVAAGEYAVFAYRIPNVSRMGGKTLTFSVWYYTTGSSKELSLESAQIFGTGGSPSTANYGIDVTKESLTTSAWTRIDLTTTLDSVSGKTLGTDNNDATVFYIWLSGGSDFNARTSSLGNQTITVAIAGAQIEYGSETSPNQYNSYEQEYQECQAYYQNSWYDGAVTNYAGSCYHQPPYGHNSGVNLVTERFPAAMRDTPTVTIYSVVNGTSGNVYNFTNTADRAAVAADIGRTGYTLQTNQATFCAAGDTMFWHYEADAEI